VKEVCKLVSENDDMFLVRSGMRGHFRFLLPQQEYMRVMNKTYQFRMYPTKKQETTLNESGIRPL